MFKLWKEIGKEEQLTLKVKAKGFKRLYAFSKLG